MAKTYGLGRGLGSLIPPKIDTSSIADSSEISGGTEHVLRIEISKIKANPHQPRTDFNAEGLEELKNSIKEHGILQPLIVTKTDKGYEIIAGERRFRASQELNLQTVPAIVREVSQQQKLELALVENIQRRDLNAIEEAVAYQRLIDEFNLTQEAVAKKVGKSRSAVTNTLRLLTLPTEIQRAVVNGKISQSTARIIVGLPAEQRLPFFQKVINQDLTVRAVETQARGVSVRKHVRKIKDPNIVSLEEQLQSALGTKTIVQKNGSAGKITIEFYSDEELENIIDKICG